jgi:L-ascorbate metabolism protein UlaG (beta-lactamase superfamily)
MSWTTHTGGVRALWTATLDDRSIGVAWLGQAGFALRTAGLRLLIDPYLSDSLAKKYAGKELPHVRLMPSPIDATFFRDLDWVLCSHRHTDHLDPETLPALASVSPECRFVVPAAEREAAIEKCGVPADRLLSVDADDFVDLGGGARVTVTPAAHEDRKRNERGEHHFIGFAVHAPAGVVWHSGDTVVFDDLAEAVRDAHVDVALLPVNGRDAYRTSRGIVGNMTFDEAAELCRAAGVARMVPHHFGLFEFNTVPIDELARAIAATASPVCTLPRVDEWYELAEGE